MLAKFSKRRDAPWRVFTEITGKQNFLIRAVLQADLLQLTQKHASDYALQWKDLLRQYLQEDKWWDWEFKLQSIISKQGNREGYAIEYEGETQGQGRLTLFTKSRKILR